MSRVLAKRSLVCHPDTPCAAIVGIGGKIQLETDESWQIEFLAVGRPHDLVILAAAPPVQSDDLWRTTCFEMFVGVDADAYQEINLSPSGAFAAYRFDRYRTGMQPLDLEPPDIAVEAGSERLSLTAQIRADWQALGTVRKIGLCAVIEEKGGRKSYWALAHAPGRPDFHHAACFAAELAAPGAS